MIDIATCFTYAYSLGTIADFVQTITTDAASTNIIDLDTAGIRITGHSRAPYLICRVVTAFASIVSLNIRVQTDSDSGFATTLRDIMQVRPALADLTAGKVVVNQPLPNLIYQRYLRLYFDVFTSATAGTMLAYLSDGPEDAETDFDQTEAAS
jgi:FMN-dependent NADH-azoreductase